MFGWVVPSKPNVAEVRSQYVHEVTPARTLDVDIASIRILFRPWMHVDPAPQNCISQMNRSILGTYWMTWSQQRPLSRRAPLASLDEPLGQIEVRLSEVQVLPPFVDTTADVLPVASTVPFPSAPLMSGGEPENERLLLKLVFLENATDAAVRPAPEKAL